MSSEQSFEVTLAGPGTGKTKRLIDQTATLIRDVKVAPRSILVITFTRAAASELRAKLSKDSIISAGQLPQATTLHAFSMRVLMSDVYRARISMPLRVLDTWETQNMLCPLMAVQCGYEGSNRHKLVDEKLEIYEAGWQSLDADHTDWSKKLDPVFHNALEAVRQVFGFTLIGELPYKLREYLKSDLGVVRRLGLSHVLVDEFQDLNPCDQEVINLLTSQGASLAVYGDDDQSIYSFRQAAPKGILHFSESYPVAQKHVLSICHRCPQPIVSLAREVIEATLMTREPKDFHAKSSEPCQIECLVFDDGGEEVNGIVRLIKWLHDLKDLEWKDMLILVPSKKYGNYLTKGTDRDSIPTDSWLKERDILNSEGMRRLYAVLRLHLDPQDALALWTYLNLTPQFGKGTLSKISEIALNGGLTFPQTIHDIHSGKIAPDNRTRNRVGVAIDHLTKDIAKVTGWFTDFETLISELVAQSSDADREWVESTLRNLFRRTEDEELTSEIVVHRMQTARLSPDIEPEMDKVRVMTMHKAKGLSAKCVIIPFLEDENLIRSEMSDAEIEERRRLLYVSLTRSKQYLFLSYSKQRRDHMQFTTAGKTPRRSRIRFFNGTSLRCVIGRQFLHDLPIGSEKKDEVM